MKKTIILFLIIVFYTCPCLANEKIYKWTDDKGVEHFSDQPPVENEEDLSAINVDNKDKSLPDSTIKDQSGETLRPGYNRMVEDAKQEILQYEQKQKELEIAKAKEEKERAEAERLAKIEAEKKERQEELEAQKKRLRKPRPWWRREMGPPGPGSPRQPGYTGPPDIKPPDKK